MARVLLVVFSLLLAIASVNSAAIKESSSRVHVDNFKKVCENKKAQRYFEWEECPSKVKGVQEGLMEHFEVKDGKCQMLKDSIRRPCPHHCPDRQEWAEFCRKNVGKGKKRYKKAREIKVITYERKDGACVAKTSYRVESCAKYIPWISCPKHERMEMGDCNKSKTGSGLRQVIVKVYARKSMEDTSCRSKTVKKWEVCDYKKEMAAASKRSKKSKAAKKAKSP